MISTSKVITSTSRARIEHLESDISSLWTTVRNLEAKLGCLPTENATRPQPQSQTKDARGLQDTLDDEESDSPMNPPAHLLQLFDNGSLGSCGLGSASPSRHAADLHKAQGSSALRRLMPSRQEMLTITAHASSWLSLYYALFPMTSLPKTSDEMLSQYDKLQDANADPVAIAALLLSVALTVQQAPDDSPCCTAGSIRDTSSFIKDVSDSVERIVISDDALSGNLEGIETTLLFLRL